jgi:hypothetical protein
MPVVVTVSSTREPPKVDRRVEQMLFLDESASWRAARSILQRAVPPVSPCLVPRGAR